MGDRQYIATWCRCGNNTPTKQRTPTRTGGFVLTETCSECGYYSRSHFTSHNNLVSWKHGIDQDVVRARHAQLKAVDYESKVLYEAQYHHVEVGYELVDGKMCYYERKCAILKNTSISIVIVGSALGEEDGE